MPSASALSRAPLLRCLHACEDEGVTTVISTSEGQPPIHPDWGWAPKALALAVVVAVAEGETTGEVAIIEGEEEAPAAAVDRACDDNDGVVLLFLLSAASS